MANSVDPDIGAVCSGSTLFAYILNLSVMLGNKSRLLFSSAAMFKEPLWQAVWTQIRLLL